MLNSVRLSLERVLAKLVPSQYRPLARGAALTTRNVPMSARGFRFARTLTVNGRPSTSKGQSIGEKTPLEAYFDTHRTGQGLWKWRHYFPIYERFFSRFVGQPVRVMEIGVYSGGSLRMWRDYFGPRSTIIGVDIEPACRAYESDGIQIVIGDQGDPRFWSEILGKLAPLDIVIDDGGHQHEQQIATLEAVLPHLRPGGVYLCEDIHGTENAFTQYLAGVLPHLHTMDSVPREEAITLDAVPVQRAQAVRTTPFQQAIAGIHWFPFVVVIERSILQPQAFVNPMHGTDWLDHGHFWSSAVSTEDPEGNPIPQLIR
jgi:hypothetical protein